jgi:putative transcriptional regulator
LEKLNLTGQFLIAMPAMTDPYFSKTVTYICTHNQDGAMGIILNRSAELSVTELLKQIDINPQSSNTQNQYVHFGGPVQMERGFILHKPMHDAATEFDATVDISTMVSLTTSKDILVAAAENNGPEHMLIALGYAGWTAGQLEKELSQNAWLNLDIQDDHHVHQLVYTLPILEKFDYAMQLMGLNFANLSHQAGHA